MSVPVALLTIASFTAAFSLSSPAGAAAQLRVVAPAVHWRPAGAGAFTPVQGTADVETRSLVRTGKQGMAELAYGDGSLTRLGPDTSYEITTLEAGPTSREIVGRLEVGRSFHRVAKVTGSQSRFEVHTSNAVAAVRGTAFAVNCPVPNVCEVAVAHGIVAVTGADGKSVSVTAGRRVGIDAAGRLGPVESLSPSDPWIAQNTAEATAPGEGADAPDAAGGTGTVPGAPGQAATDGGGTTPAGEPTTSGGGSGGGEASTTGSAPTAPGRNVASTSPGASSRPDLPATGPTAVTPSSRVPSSTVPVLPVPTSGPSVSVPLCPGWPGADQASPQADPDGECQPCISGDAGSYNPYCPDSQVPAIPGPGGSTPPAPGGASRPIP